MAMAWIVLGPATVIADAGLGLALVQRRELTSSAIRYCFCVQVLIALLVALAVCALAPLLAAFFAAPDLENLLLALSSVVVVQAFGLTAVNLLRRSLSFRRLQLLQLWALAGSTLFVSLPLAWAGAGTWSLVAGALANIAVLSAGAAIAQNDCDLRPKATALLTCAAAVVPAILLIGAGNGWSSIVAATANLTLVLVGVRLVGRGQGMRELRRLGGFGTVSLRFLLLNIVNGIVGALPALLIGRLFGVAAVGLYDRTYALVVTPLDRAAAAISGVLFSYHAQLHRDGNGQAGVFVTSLTGVLFLGLPFAAIVGTNDALIIRTAFGSEWLGAVPLVLPLATLVVLILALQVAVPVLNGRGRPEIELAIQVVSVVLFLLTVVLMPPAETADILWLLVGAYGFRVLCLLSIVGFFVTRNAVEIISTAIPGSIAVGLVLAGSSALSAAMPSTVSGVGRLAATAAIGTVALAVTWLLCRHLKEYARPGMPPRDLYDAGGIRKHPRIT
jgi:lipopolysaccharide exporter